MPRLSNVERLRAIGRLYAGQSVVTVARAFNCSRQTIINLRMRVLQTGTIADRPRAGAPRVTSLQEDQAIRLRHLRNRFVTATSTSREMFGGRVTAQTVRNRLQAAGLRARRPYNGPILTPLHRRNRLVWATRHIRFTQRQWNSVVFSDESRFTLRFADGRVRVYRRRGERYAQVCVREVDRFGGGSVMVWGSFCAHGRSPLVVVQGNLNAVQYRDQILQPVLLPFMQRHGPGLTFQQDNARPHTAIATQNFLRNAGVQVLDWPSLSPDLNPIEHIWDELGRRVRQQVNPPLTLQDLQHALAEQWRRLPRVVFTNVLRSMRRRCVAVRDARGGHNRY